MAAHQYPASTLVSEDGAHIPVSEFPVFHSSRLLQVGPGHLLI